MKSFLVNQTRKLLRQVRDDLVARDQVDTLPQVLEALDNLNILRDLLDNQYRDNTTWDRELYESEYEENQ